LNYLIKDTIAAVVTPAGRSAIGVVKLSGPKAIHIAKKIFFLPSGKTIKELTSHCLYFGKIIYRRQLIDEAVLSIMLAPRSHTGEDVVEFSLHGNPLILEKMLSVCTTLGARAALGGEFSFRAYLNGKMDLTKAEAVCELIKSQTALAAQAALTRLGGALSEKINQLRQIILDIASHAEAALDHPEEGIEFLDKIKTQKTLGELINSTLNIADSAKSGIALSQGIKIALIGRPNVGKSSLLNILLKRERAIVTNIAGTTRDTIAETVEVGGFPVTFTDTAGIRARTTSKVEKIGQARALGEAKTAHIVLWLIDSSRTTNQDDKKIKNILCKLKTQEKTLVLLNKSDLSQKAAGVKKLIGELPLLNISAKTGKGISELEKKILKLAGVSNAYNQEGLLVNERQKNGLLKCAKELRLACTALEKMPEEIVALHLRCALSCLDELTGNSSTQDILDNIFSKFCIGK